MKTMKLLPGIIISVAIAAVAVWIEGLLPIHLIGAAVIAMFIGMIVNHFLNSKSVFAAFAGLLLVFPKNNMSNITMLKGKAFYPQRAKLFILYTLTI